MIFVVLAVATGTVHAQSNDPSASDSPSPTWVASIKETSTWCGTVIKANDRFGEPTQDDATPQPDVRESSSTGSSVLMAEDMRCRQCHGKCEADTLRCRSQCLNDTACLAHCEERSTKCAGMCKQLFQCQ